MFQYRITTDLGSQLDLSAGINAQLLPLVNQAVNGIAQATAGKWVEAVQRAKLWSGEKDAYAKTITYKMTGDFSAVVSSDYKYSQDIETGRPAYDMKKMLLTSKKIRYVQKGKNAGKRFLIIPLRHNTPSNDALATAMPDSVHQMAKMLTPSSITGSQMQRNGGTGARVRVVKRNTYDWGSRLTSSALKASGASAFDQKRFAGMVRFNTSTPGGSKSSSFLTFRVMGEWSSGWIMGAKPGQYIARDVAQEMQPLAETVLGEAIKRVLG